MNARPSPRLSAPIALALALFAAAPATADSPAIVDRVVAIVGDGPILASEVREQAAPFLRRVDQEVAPAKRAAARREVWREAVEQRVESALLALEAERLHVTVTSDEIDSTLRTIGASNNLSIEVLLEAAAAQGYNEAAYREHLRRQLSEGKLLGLKAASAIRVTDDDLRAAYQQEQRRSVAIGTFEAARDALYQRVYAGKLDALRAQLIATLKQSTYVEVRP